MVKIESTFSPHMPAEVGDEFSIPGCRGLRMRVGKNDRTWFMRYRPPGGVTSKLLEGKLGVLSDMSMVQAIGAWETRKKVLASGTDPFAAERAEKAVTKTQREVYTRSGVSLKVMAETWLEKHSDHNKRGWEVRRMVTQELEAAPDFANKQASNLSRSDVADFLESIIARGAPSIARMTRQALGQAFEWAMDNGLVPDSANNQFKRALKNDKRISQKARKRALNELELEVFVTWLPQSGMSKNVRSMLELILRTGMRPGEVASMEWRNISLKKGIYELPDELTKTGSGRQVQLSTQVVALLESLFIKDAKHVFAWRNIKGEVKDKPIRPHAMNVSMGIAPYRWPGEHWTPHDLRRTCRTTLARLGCPAEVGEMILGHAVGDKVAQTYNVHSYLPEQREWLQKLNDYLDTVAK